MFIVLPISGNKLNNQGFGIIRYIVDSGSSRQFFKILAMLEMCTCIKGNNNERRQYHIVNILVLPTTGTYA
jgi:hypothetical protein